MDPQPQYTAATTSAPRKFAPWAGRLVTILTACAIFLGIFVRVYAPGAPSPLWFYTYNTDEGHYSYCAHNMLNEGRFFVNDAKYSLATPLFCLLQYVFAAPWNATWGIARYRFVSIAAGLVLCVILGYFFPRGRLRWSVVALSLLSFMGVVHSRYAIPDTLLAMMMTACAWLALRGSEPAARRSWLFFAGAVAVAGVAVKFTGIVMVAVLLLLPVVCREMAGRRRMYYQWTLTGMAAAGVIIAAIVIRPDPASWLFFEKASTAYARENVNINPLDFAKGLGTLIASPAIHTMPILCLAAAAWLLIVFLPRGIRGKAPVDETLIALWLATAVAELAGTMYQPARWQMMILPPMTIAGVRFFMSVRGKETARLVLALAPLIMLIYLLRGFDKSSLATENAVASNQRILLLTSAALAAGGIGILCARLAKSDWRIVLLSGVIPFEIAWQIFLVGTNVLPTYRQPDIWRPVISAVESVQGEREFCLAGDMVQDLSLRLPIKTIPTYYVLDQEKLSDAALRSFFQRQSPRPTHMLLFDFPELWRWNQTAAGCMSNLELVSQTMVPVGELGWRKVSLFKVKDRSWFEGNR